ncbi:MAG: alpha/beta hydrolase [Candidatus Eisenbacteria bacterium]
MPSTLTWDMETHFETAGEGHPVVLIHGLTLDLRIWNPQWKVLSRGAHVVRYDLRGHGESSAPAGLYSAENLAMQLRTLLDALRISRPILVGHAFGAALALHFALLHRTRVAALVLANPEIWGAPVPEESAYQPGKSPIDDAGVVEDPRTCKRALQAWLQSPLFEATRRNQQAFRAIESIALAHGCAPWTRPEPFEQPDDWSSLSSIDIPTLVLFGSNEDAYFRAAARSLGERIPGTRVIELPETGHAANVEKPVEFNRHALEFLQALGFVGALRPGAEIPPKARRKKRPRGGRKKPEREPFRPPPPEEKPPASKPQRERRRRRRRPRRDEAAPAGGERPPREKRPAPAEPPKEEKRGFWSRLFGKKNKAPED